MSEKKTTVPSITLALPAGRLSGELFAAVNRVVQQYGLSCYMTTMQNMRLLEVDEDKIVEIKEALTSVGLVVKKPGMFPLPRVCAGRPYCKLAVADPAELSGKIVAQLGERLVKPKIKLAISGCPANCSNAILADIGVVATKSGFDLFIGGKGGAKPKAGVKIIRRATAERIVEAITTLLDFHDLKTVRKKRMYKLMEDPDFPFVG